MLIKRWPGNDTSKISLKDCALDKLFSFYLRHKNNYVFGDGKIGSALSHYLRQSNMTPSGMITSQTLDGFKDKYTKTEIGVIMGVSDKNLLEVMPKLLQVVDDDDIFILPTELRENIGEHFSLRWIEQNFWLNIFATNVCNLNCKSCSTFAPICKNQPDHYGVGQFREDLENFKTLGFNTINMVKFTGGEPFLHPQLFDLLACGRELYPDTVIECYTNGLKLANMKEDELKHLKDSGVNIVITEYPLSNLRLDSFYELADKIGLGYNIIGSEGIKFFSKRPLNFSKTTAKYQFANCPRYKMCDSLFLFKGKLYKCIYTFASSYVNKAFDKNLKVLDSDYLNVTDTSKCEIFEFCRTRIPFCGYCEPISELIPWGLSENKIEEWS